MWFGSGFSKENVEEKTPSAFFATEAFENPHQTTKTRLMNILMQLRKCVNHPYLFDGQCGREVLFVRSASE